jgi:hypothetical protein
MNPSSLPPLVWLANYGSDPSIVYVPSKAQMDNIKFIWIKVVPLSRSRSAASLSEYNILEIRKSRETPDH